MATMSERDLLMRASLMGDGIAAPDAATQQHHGD
jgi:hypothetical protein